MNKEAAELLVRTVQRHYGDHPNTREAFSDLRIRRIGGTEGLQNIRLLVRGNVA